MYEPYPDSGPASAPVRPQAPVSVVRAVRLMYVGAGVEVVALIVGLITRGSLNSAILRAHPHYTATQLHNAEIAQTTAVVVGALIAVGLWLWMAWADGKGKSWARILSAVFFGIGTLAQLASFIVARSGADRIVGAVGWLVGLVTIVLLFSKESGPFFQG
jgi:hypothetical protein